MPEVPTTTTTTTLPLALHSAPLTCLYGEQEELELGNVRAEFEEFVAERRRGGGSSTSSSLPTRAELLERLWELWLALRQKDRDLQLAAEIGQHLLDARLQQQVSEDSLLRHEHPAGAALGRFFSGPEQAQERELQQDESTAPKHVCTECERSRETVTRLEDDLERLRAEQRERQEQQQRQAAQPLRQAQRKIHALQADMEQLQLTLHARQEECDRLRANVKRLAWKQRSAALGRQETQTMEPVAPQPNNPSNQFPLLDDMPTPRIAPRQPLRSFHLDSNNEENQPLTLWAASAPPATAKMQQQRRSHNAGSVASTATQTDRGCFCCAKCRRKRAGYHQRAVSVQRSPMLSTWELACSVALAMVTLPLMALHRWISPGKRAH